MGHQLIKQPDGLYCVWSTIVDDFVWGNMTAEEYVNQRAERAAEEATKDALKIINDMEVGNRPYGHWTMTYQEALDYKEMLAIERVRADAEEVFDE